MHPRVYDRRGQYLGVLTNAVSVSYRQVHNDLWTGSFSLPAQSPENDLCQAVYTLVELFDGDRRIGLFRICGEEEAHLRGQSHRQYRLEHVLAFLMDDRIGDWLELGGNTRQILTHLLSLQSEARWALGQCDFDFQFQYLWEAEDLLSCLYSVPLCFQEGYSWTFDTSQNPWVLNLVRADTVPASEIALGRNEVQLIRSRDLEPLCTRLYCLGSGEGVNRTSIREAAGNVSGLPYIESPAVSRYGVIARHYIDTSISSADLLYEKGRAILRELEVPRISYSVSALDLSRLTGLPLDGIEAGRIVRVRDPELGLTFQTVVQSVEKADVFGDPLGLEVCLSSRTGDTAQVLEDLSRRTAIQAQYAQGATNLYPMQIMDNADEAHPARLRFFVPESCRRINRVLLSYTLSPFRAYSTGSESGGGEFATTQEGGGSTQTSTTGGASTQTSSGASQSRGTTRQRTVTETVTTSLPVVEGQSRDYTGGPVNALGQDLTNTGTASGNTGGSGDMNTGISRNAQGVMNSTGSGGAGDTGTALASISLYDAGGHTHGGTSHRHGTNTHNHSLGSTRTGDASPNTTYESTGMNSAGSHTHDIYQHSHSHTVYGHSHAMGHWHTLDSHTHPIGSHTHGMSHQHRFSHAHTVQVAVTVPALEVTLEEHTHQVTVPGHSHSVTVPSHSHRVMVSAHTHGIRYGIFEGQTAKTVRVQVDGQDVPESALTEGGRIRREIDVVPYLAMTDGRITRGTWHEVTLIPDSLTRIEANLFVQTFVTSWQGGSY